MASSSSPPAAAESSGPTTCGDPLTVANFNKTATPPPMMILTQNYSPTFLSTGNPCLDFFFHVVPDTPSESLRSRLQLAWDHDPLKALKLVGNLLAGKSDKHSFDTAARWLHENHPKTGEYNAAIFEQLYEAKDGPREMMGTSNTAEWQSMVDEMAKKGELSNSLSICDVSESMEEDAMEAAVALGVLVSELSEGPWKGKLITFSKSAELQMAKGDSLREKTEFLGSMNRDRNANFQKVFDLIHQVAVDGKLKGDDMTIKRLFVFSDMEFDRASRNPWETDYKAIVRKFRESGYGEECVPEIVFWNLTDSPATPVPGNQKGVALVSGFSENLLTLFLEKGGALDPFAVMESAIAGEEYQKLVVVD